MFSGTGGANGNFDLGLLAPMDSCANISNAQMPMNPALISRSSAGQTKVLNGRLPVAATMILLPVATPPLDRSAIR
jgi:hypothetical protein